MEHFFSSLVANFTDVTFYLKIGTVVLMDAMLSGDNAAVIALAAGKLDPKQRKSAMMFGVGGAVVARLLFLAIISYLLMLPFIHFGAGVILLIISLKLLKTDEEDANNIKEANNLLGAIITIVIADMTMSLDNVAAVVGVANGNFLVMAIGIIISIALVMTAATAIVALMDRFKWIIIVGSSLLSYCAGGMVIEDKSLAHLVKPMFELESLHYVFPSLLVVITIAYGVYLQRKYTKQNNEKAA